MNAVVNELGRRVSMLVTRARCALVDDEKKMQQVQVELLADETKDAVERFQQYGFTSHPLNGAEAVSVFLGGGRDHGIVLAIDDRRYRLTKLEKGDVALYTDEGTKIVLGRERTITIDCDKRHEESSEEVTIKTKTFKVECETLELSASSSITVTSPSVDVNE
jgi:phage baseplate assembly protein V